MSRPYTRFDLAATLLLGLLIVLAASILRACYANAPHTQAPPPTHEVIP
jgi:hypothetical protein